MMMRSTSLMTGTGRQLVELTANRGPNAENKGSTVLMRTLRGAAVMDSLALRVLPVYRSGKILVR